MSLSTVILPLLSLACFFFLGIFNLASGDSLGACFFGLCAISMAIYQGAFLIASRRGD